MTPERRADIERLLDITGAMSIGKQMSEGMVTNLVQGLQKSNAKMPQNAVDAMIDEINKLIAEELPALRTQLVPLYGKYFTQADIQGLLQFYETELGQRLVKTMPLLVNDSMSIGQDWGNSLGPKLQQRITDRFKRDGITP